MCGESGGGGLNILFRGRNALQVSGELYYFSRFCPPGPLLA